MRTTHGIRRLVYAVGSEDTPGRLRATWRILVPFGIVLGLGIAVTGVLATIRFGSHLGAGLVGDGLLALIGGAVLLVSARYVDDRPITEYGFRLSRGWWADFGAGAILGVGLVGAVFLTSYAMGGVAVDAVFAPGDAGSFAPWVLLLGLGYLGTAFWEETLFRGIFITNAAEGLAARGYAPRTRLLLALVISTVVFGAIHGPLGTVPGESSLAGMLAVWTLMGGLLGLAFVISGELAFPMGVHFAVNYAFNNVFFGADIAGYATLPAVLRTEVTASALLHPFSGLPMVGAILLGYGATLGWFYRRDGEISVAVSIGERSA